MTPRDDILARFGAGAPAGLPPAYLPDLTLWYKWHTTRGSLPADWQRFSMPAVARAMGVPAWAPVQPWRLEYTGVDVNVEETPEARTILYDTPHGRLKARWILGPDGDWWQDEYPVKTTEDLLAAQDVVAARTYVLDPARYLAARDEVGEDGIVPLELPMRPYSDLLHTLLGWGEGLMLLLGPGAEACQEMLANLERKLQSLTVQAAGLPGEVALAPDNLDGQYISPRHFRAQLESSYRKSAETLHAAGMRLVVHTGGPMRRLLPLLAEAGVDAVEGVAGPPQSDATLDEGREAAGDGLCLWGGIPQDLLVRSAHDWNAFEPAVLEAARRAAQDPRMILGVADRVSVDSDLDRLLAIPEIAKQA